MSIRYEIIEAIANEAVKMMMMMMIHSIETRRAIIMTACEQKMYIYIHDAHDTI